MTARLSFCVKAATDLSADELDALTKGIEGYREAGVGDAESQLLAATDLEAEAQREREALMKAVREQVPEAFVAPAAAPAPAQSVRRAASGRGAGTARIADFGERLEGARKDYATLLKEAGDVDVAAEPLSKSWPEPDYQRLLDNGTAPAVVAFIRSARDEVPTKPQKSWKLKGWVESVRSLRSAAQALLDGTVTAERMLEMRKSPAFARVDRSVGARADLYEAVGHERSLKGVRLTSGAYGIFGGVEYNPPKTFWSVEQDAKATMFGNWPRQLAVAETREGAIAAFKEKMGTTDLGRDAKKQPQFVIYRKRGQDGAWVGKKVGREYIDLHKADDVAAARKYMTENAAALEKALERYKETPFERNRENRPRVGDDHRNGAPVTPEVFAETFGFRGVQFGNYVEQGRRQSDLNEAFDGLMDLAAVLGVQTRALSLNGRLGLAFGARGRGGKEAPAAHFEPDKVVINLTKGSGPGSLAHEWWHALDNYFAREGGGGSFVTEGGKTDKLRDEMKRAFKTVQDATSTKTLRERSLELDKRKSKPYWNTPAERSARSFESYVIAKLHDQGAANDYLANIVSKEFWDAQEALRAMDLSDQKKAETYPYPTVDEMPTVRTAFDDFFRTVETREDEAGNMALYSVDDSQANHDTSSYAFDTDRAHQNTVRFAMEAIGGDGDGYVLQAVVPPRDRTDLIAAAAIARDIGGHEVIFARQPNGRRINGAAFQSGRDYLLIDVDSTRPAMAVVGHEMLHRLRALRPDLYQRLEKQLKAVLTGESAYATDLRAKYERAGLEQIEDQDTIREELLADVFGDEWSDPEFWRELGREQPSGWRAVVDAIAKLLDDIIAAVSTKRPFGTQRYIGDLRAARDAVIEATREFSAGRVGALADRQGLRLSVAAGGQTDSAAFKRWFGDSKVVDAQGKPLVVYHGTGQAMRGGAFNPDLAMSEGGGFYFSHSPLMKNPATNANDYAANRSGDSANVMPVYLRMLNPLVVGFTEPMPEGDKAIGEWLDRMQRFNRSIDMTKERYYKQAIRDARAGGHDGVIVRNVEDVANDAGRRFTDEADVYIAFKPEQIKSATGNRGTFDQNEADIRLSVADDDTPFARAASGRPVGVREQKRDVQQHVREKLADVLADTGAKVSWFDKTLGTQYSKAQKHAGFKRVFDLAQQYLEDTSSFANEAADQARDILPKLETWRDLTRHGIFQHGMSAKDSGAVAAPVFEGTLMWTRGADGKPVRMDDVETAASDLNAEAKGREMFRRGLISEQVLKMWQGLPLEQYERNVESRYASTVLRPGIVWTDAELKQQFGLSERQVGLYRQFRASVETSLDQVLAADVMRLLKVSDPAMRELAVNDRAEFKRKVDEVLAQRREEAGDAAGADLAAQVMDKYARVQQLKDEGYAPLMRFGKYKVHVVSETGETQFFGLYETGTKANEVARLLADDPEFKKSKIERGVLSEEQFKLFAQVPLDSLEMFAEAVGAEKSAIYQDFIKLARSNRSALKRLINRKGTAGFSDDVPRVLAAFVTSNSRMAAGAMSIPAGKEAAAEIRDGDTQDEAIKLLDTVENPKETAGLFRGLMFMNFIGGSIASALVNITQPVTMTLPYLSQWGGGTKAAARLMAAGKQLASGGGSLELRAALKKAEADGIVSPQEIHHLTAQAMGTWGSNPIAQKLAFIWAAPFSLAEQFNRRISFVAAYNTAKEQGVADPFAFAERAVTETQGLYNKANAPNWARNPIGASALTFKQFSIHYLEWFVRMAKNGPEGRKAALLALAILVVAAGVDGLPFAGDADDLVDTLGQALGYDTNAKRWRRNLLANELGFGDEFADLLARGASAAPGVPFDVSLRMSMGNMIPATGLLLRSNTDRTRDVLEVAGPAGGLAKQYLDAGQKALAGEFADAALGAMPVAIQNIGKAAKMWETGEARDTLGRKVMDADEIDAAMRFLGFNPAAIARESEKIGMIRRSEQLAKNVEGEIAGAWARAMADGNGDAVAEARERLADWNERNPEQPIRITSSQILRRVKAIRRERAERFITSVAPERRARVAEELRQ